MRGPIGPTRDYICAAMISANIINALGGKVTVADLMPDFQPVEEAPADKPDVDGARLKLHMLRLMEQQKRKAGASSPPSET